MEQKRNGKAVASLVLGILANCSALLPYFKTAGIVCAMIGLVLGAQAKAETASGMAKTGFALNLAALCCFTALFLTLIACAFIILGVIVTAL